MGVESPVVVVVVVEEEVEEAMGNLAGAEVTQSAEWVCRVKPRVHEIVTTSAVLPGSR